MYERTKDRAQLAMINDIYQGNYNQYDGYNWDNTKTWFIYDDMMWWVIALARANQLTGNDVYLQKAISGFNRVWNGSYDSVNGGMFWDFKHSGKNACINYPTVIAAMRLYKITGDAAYLDKAKSIYRWAKANLFDAASGRVADHKIGNNPPGYEDYTYNQGTAIGAAVMLYKETKDKAYLADAKLAADYTRSKMSANGILPAEGDFNEQGILKAIFAQYSIWIG
jgi:predicted alpha-1,6-mannanase (GH76 family)